MRLMKCASFVALTQMKDAPDKQSLQDAKEEFCRAFGAFATSIKQLVFSESHASASYA